VDPGESSDGLAAAALPLAWASEVFHPVSLVAIAPARKEPDLLRNVA